MAYLTQEFGGVTSISRHNVVVPSPSHPRKVEVTSPVLLRRGRWHLLFLLEGGGGGGFHVSFKKREVASPLLL